MIETCAFMLLKNVKLKTKLCNEREKIYHVALYHN